MNSPREPSVLFVFYTHTEQSRRMAGALRERDCDVSLAGIEFTDPRYAGKFGRFPFRHAVLDLLAVLPAQVRRSTGQIRIPDAAREGDYDLVCLGSPTWFFTTNMPLRSYLKSAEAERCWPGKRFVAYVVCRRYWSINLKEVRKLGTAQGGAYADGHPFPVRGRPRHRPPHPDEYRLPPVPDRAVPPVKGEACKPRTCNSQGRWRSCGAIRRRP